MLWKQLTERKYYCWQLCGRDKTPSEASIAVERRLTDDFTMYVMRKISRGPTLPPLLCQSKDNVDRWVSRMNYPSGHKKEKKYSGSTNNSNVKSMLAGTAALLRPNIFANLAWRCSKSPFICVSLVHFSLPDFMLTKSQVKTNNTSSVSHS